jgi:hypothetical protein
MEDLLYVGAGVFFDLKSYGKLAIAISYRTCQSNIPVTCNVTRHHAPASNVVIGTCAAGDELHLKVARRLDSLTLHDVYMLPMLRCKPSELLACLGQVFAPICCRVFEL